MSTELIDQWIAQNEKRSPAPVLDTVENRIKSAVTKKEGIRIGANDPGQMRDSWGYVGIQVKPESPFIQILGAQRWLGRAYLKVEEKVAVIHRQFNYDFQVVELNNTGLHAYEILKYVKHLPVIGVTTSKNLNKDVTKKYDPRKFPTVDKNDMFKWMIAEKDSGHFLFPSKKTPEIIALMDQLSGIVETKTPGGTVRYAAEGEEHDDLVMALMLALWLARRKFLQIKRGVVASGGSYYRGENLSEREKFTEAINTRMANSGLPNPDTQITF